MSSFTFIGENGTYTSDDLGLMITAPVVRPSWGQVSNEVTAPGSTRKIVQWLKTYDNAELTIRMVLADDTPENARAVYSALRGYGKLILSSSPDEYMNVSVKPLVPEAVAQLTAEIPISFVCEPFAYAIEPTTVEINGAGSIIENTGTMYSAPTIKLIPGTTSDITISVNNKPFVLAVPADLAYKQVIIDCDAQITYYIEDGVKHSINQYTTYDYPLLHPGDNLASVTGTAAADVIINERWL